MLSYRHSFHAGNFADLLKHIVQVEALEHLTKKDKPFDYIDTHSGAGLYALSAPQSKKTAEYKDGIGKIKAADFPELAEYFAVIDHYNDSDELTHYPGSPAIAMQYLRSKDRGWLFELHSTDTRLLEQLTSRNRKIRVQQSDGYKGLLGLLPPASRRALVLMDPPYEIKDDYQKVSDTLIKAHSKFATGTYALWYPVVERKRINQLELQLRKSGIRNIQQFELGMKADTNEHGMTAAGMIVINPPWTLMQRMQDLLPKLVAAIDTTGEAFYRIETLVEE